MTEINAHDAADLAACVAELDRWIAYIETGLPNLTDDEDLENYLVEAISKPHRRGVISDQLAYDLADHFDVLEAF
jgi:hypothetical protein